MDQLDPNWGGLVWPSLDRKEAIVPILTESEEPASGILRERALPPALGVPRRVTLGQNCFEIREIGGQEARAIGL